MRWAIVIPCYNHAHLLPMAWRSVLSQTMPSFDAILVNDCAQDNTQQVMDGLQTRDGINLVRVSTPANMGQAAVLNFGISITRADYIMILNDDDYLAHDAMDVAQYVINATRTDLFGASCQPFDGNWLNNHTGPWTVKERIGDYANIELQLRKPRAIDRHNPDTIAMTHSGMSVSRRAWEAVGGYFPLSKRYVQWSDRDFQIRVALQFGCVMATGVQLSYWRSDSSVDRGRNS